MFDFEDYVETAPNIPKAGDVVRGRIIKVLPGGYTDLMLGLPDGLGTTGKTNPNDVQVVLEFSLGVVKKKKWLTIIGSDAAVNISKGEVLKMFNSHLKLSNKDKSDAAIAARKALKATGYKGLENLDVQVLIGPDKNPEYITIAKILTPDDPEYVPF